MTTSGGPVDLHRERGIREGARLLERAGVAPPGGGLEVSRAFQDSMDAWVASGDYRAFQGEQLLDGTIALYKSLPDTPTLADWEPVALPDEVRSDLSRTIIGLGERATLATVAEKLAPPSRDYLLAIILNRIIGDDLDDFHRLGLVEVPPPEV